MPPVSAPTLMPLGLPIIGLPLSVRDPNVVTPAVETNRGKKRSHDETEPRTIPDIHLPGEDEDNLEYDIDCNAIRRRITTLLNSGEMKVTEFQRLLGINSISYSRFMKLKGPWSGIDNQTFNEAYKFFKKRDLAGIKSKPAKKMKAEDNAQFDVSGIHLDGEEDESVPIYDTPADMRNKINAHLRNSNMSQAELGRRIGEMFPDSRNIQGAQMKRFLTAKGPFGGAESGVYYGSYVWFEKLGIKTGGKETKKRLELKGVHPDGIERQDLGLVRVLCTAGVTPYFDSMGRYHCR